MKTIATKMKNYAYGVSIVNNNNMEKKILSVLILSFCFSALIYVSFLGNMVFNIVERKTVEAKTRVLNNDVGNLEGEYLAMSNKVDLALAYSLGFKETKIKCRVVSNEHIVI